jgi:hypothetical protein
LIISSQTPGVVLEAVILPAGTGITVGRDAGSGHPGADVLDGVLATGAAVVGAEGVRAVDLRARWCATYCPAMSPLAYFGAPSRQASNTAWSAGAVGRHSDRCTTLTVRVGWLSRPTGAFAVRIRIRWDCTPVNCVVMSPLGLPA